MENLFERIDDFRFALTLKGDENENLFESDDDFRFTPTLKEGGNRERIFFEFQKSKNYGGESF